MKKFQIIFMLLFTAFTEAQNVVQIKELIQNVETAIATQKISDPLQTATPMRMTEEYKALEKQSHIIWEYALANIDQVAPTEIEKVILFDSFQSLDSETYLVFLDKVTDLYAAGKLDISDLFNYIIFTDGKKWGFLASNYQNPSVIRVVQKLKKAVNQNPSKQKSLDYILSGKGKLSVEQNIAGNPDYKDRVIAVLPTPKDNSTPIPARNTPGLKPQSASKPIPAITPAAKSPSQETSSIPLVVGILLLFAIIGFVFYRRKP